MRVGYVSCGLGWGREVVWAGSIREDIKAVLGEFYWLKFRFVVGFRVVLIEVYCVRSVGRGVGFVFSIYSDG